MPTPPGSVVWVFNGANGRFPAGVFSTLDRAEAWVKANELTGVLTAYPLDEGVLDWALRTEAAGASTGKLTTRRSDPAFVGAFSSAYQEHYHYEGGARCS